MSHNYKNTIHGLKKINKTKESKRFEEKCGGGGEGASSVDDEDW